MKVLFYIFLLYILGVSAQRRLVQPDVTNSETRPAVRSRGRTRFALTPEYAEIETEAPSRRKPPVEKSLPRPTKEPTTKFRPYEVKEVIDDIPREDTRKVNKKPRVVTETRFEANIPSRTDLFEPEPKELPLPSVTPEIPENPAASETPLSTQSATPSSIPTSSTEKPSTETYSKITTESTPTQVKRVQPQVPRRGAASRPPPRTRINLPQKEVPTTTPGARAKTRTPGVRAKTERPIPTTIRTTFRQGRRRSESVAESVQNPVRTRGPSVLPTNTNQDFPTRSRTGRKVNLETEKKTSDPSQPIEEKLERPTRVNLAEQRRVSGGGERRNAGVRTTTTNLPEKINLNISERKVTRVAAESSTTRSNINNRGQRRGSSKPNLAVEATTSRPERFSRDRLRSRSFLTLNEQKLEVLPLFEIEPKTVPATVTVPSSLGRRRSLNYAQDIARSSTKQIEVVLKVEKEQMHSETTPIPNAIRVSREESISVDAKTEKSIHKVYKKRLNYLRNNQAHTSEPTISVSQEVVTELPKIHRFRALGAKRNEEDSTTVRNDDREASSKTTIKVDEPKVSFRQVTRKVVQKKDKASGELTISQEAISDGDNYPVSFKAAILAKRNKKEGQGSRSIHSNELSAAPTTTEKTVTSPIPLSTHEPSAPLRSSTIKNNHDEEGPTVKSPRTRFSLTTKKSKLGELSSRPRKYPHTKLTTTTTTTTEKNEDNPTSTQSPLQKFHARFKSARGQKENITQRSAPKHRNYAPKPAKGLYSSRKFARNATENNEETEKPKIPKFKVETSALSTKVPPLGHNAKNSTKFSSRYRSDILPRSGAHRTSTSGPSYIPTVPTVTPPSTSVKFQENEVVGMEVISFDDPVANTVPSANLIREDYLTSPPSTKIDPSLESNGAATTEKPISIIERIINSITSISTTTSPDSTTKTFTSTNGHSTENSAILSLVSKRPKNRATTLDLPFDSDSQLLTVFPNNIDYRTTEKPTTIIEKILSSLSAIRADAAQETTTLDPLQVGDIYNTIDTTLPTESTSTVLSKATTPMSKDTGALALSFIDSTTVDTRTASSSRTTNLDISTTPIRSSTLVPRSISTTIEIATSTPIETTTSSSSTPFYTTTENTQTSTVSSPFIFSSTEARTTTIPTSTTSVTTTAESTTTPLQTTTPTPTSSSITTTQANTTPMRISTLVPRSIATSTVAPAPTRSSTTLDPTKVFDEILSDQTLPRRTIDKLLALLNIVSPSSKTTEATTPKLVVVTPKLTTYYTVTSEETATPAPTTAPEITTIPTTTTTPTTTEISDDINLIVNPLTVEEQNALILEMISKFMITTEEPANDETTIITTTPASDTESTIGTTASFGSSTTGFSSPTPTESPTVFNTVDGSSIFSILSRMLSDITNPSTSGTSPTLPSSSVNSQTTNNEIIRETTPSNLDTYTTYSYPTTTKVIRDSTSARLSLPITTVATTQIIQNSPTVLTTTDTTPSTSNFQTTTDSPVDVPSTLPTLANFEVSPDRVKIYSANDVSSTFLPDEIDSTTISISGRSFISSLSTTAIPQSTPGTTIFTTAQNVAASSTTTINPTTTNTITSAATPNNIVSSSTTLIPVQVRYTNTPKDVSSNIIDTSATNDQKSLVNTADVANLVNQLSATNVPVAQNNSAETPATENSNSSKNTMVKMMMIRDGKLLPFEPNPLDNAIPNTPVIREKDYFIFAVLSNNTILRKRPSMYPTKETPFLIYGVLPNNTLIQKFPNGTVVPMEQVIQVEGFDTRENPPPPANILSNQVTPNKEIRPDNNIVSTGDVAQNSVTTVAPNQLSANDAITTSTLPPLTEILQGKTITEFNNIVEKTAKIQTLDVDPLTNVVRLDNVIAHSDNVIYRWKPVNQPKQVQKKLNVEDVEINTISSASSSPPPPPATQPSSTPSTTSAATTLTPTAIPTTFPSSTAGSLTTTTTPIVTTFTIETTTGVPPPYPPASETTLESKSTQTTTFFPVFVTTLSSTLQPKSESIATTMSPSAYTSPPITTSFLTTITSSDSPNPLSAFSDAEDIIAQTVLPQATLMDLLSKTTTPLPSSVISTTLGALQDLNLKQKQLTEQQKLDLATLEALEREQAAILQQLAFLTGLNVGSDAPPSGNDNLADRVIATAVNKVKDSGSTNSPPSFNLLQSLMPKETRQAKSITQSPSVEELVKQINVNGLNSVTPSGPIVASTYGKTNDALLASLLKEYGVGPSTPPILTGAFVTTSTTVPFASTTPKKRMVTTTPVPGRLMQGINWLLNAIIQRTPQPQPKPKAKPKLPPKRDDEEEEILSRQPTEIASVIVASPATMRPVEQSTVVSPQQLSALIKQLQEIQKDPKKAKDLNIEQFINLRATEKNVEIISASSLGTLGTVRTTGRTLTTTPLDDNEIKPLIVNRGRVAKSTTSNPVSFTSNSIVENGGLVSKGTVKPVALKEVPGVVKDVETTTTKSKIPPVKLNPVRGIPDGNPVIRGQLVNYAINVTKAISTFLGSALQGAANSFQSIIRSGSNTAGNNRIFDSSSRPG